MSRIAIVTVNFFSANFTLRLIEQVITNSKLSPNFDIYVIDNSASSEQANILLSGILRLLQIYHLDYEARVNRCIYFQTSRLGIGFHPAKKNLGFGAGCNLGVQIAMHEVNYNWLWFLNNDCTIATCTLTEFVRFSESTHLVAFGTDIETIDSHMVINNYGVGRIHWLTATTRLYSHCDEIRKIDYIHGSSLAIRPYIFNKLDGFDEDYFHYYEETDLCVRASAYGDLGLAKDVHIKHYCGGSSGNSLTPGLISIFCDYYSVRNRLLFILKVKPIYAVSVIFSIIGYVAIRLTRRQYYRAMIVSKAIFLALLTVIGFKSRHPEVNVS